LVETERWDSTETLLAPLQTVALHHRRIRYCAEGKHESLPDTDNCFQGCLSRRTLPISYASDGRYEGLGEAQQRITDLQNDEQALAGTPAPINSLRVMGLEIRNWKSTAVFRASKGALSRRWELLRKAYGPRGFGAAAFGHFTGQAST